MDAGVVAGQTITVHYDPLLAKLITHAASREDALQQMRQAVREYEILGLRHNLAFLRTVLDRHEVRTADVWTTFLEETLDALVPDPPAGTRRASAAFAAFAATREPAPAAELTDEAADARHVDPWDQLGPVAW